MILRKPYAFLIKHFRLIHLVLSILFLYLLFQTGNINGFFNDFVNAGYVTNEVNIASTYIHPYIYIAIILILVINIAIFFLMRQKEKSTKLYMGIITFYIVLLICTFITASTMKTIETGELSFQVARIYKDISFAVYPFQIFFFCYALLRGIGFDIKKFDFETDAKELEITDLDREEFEIVLGKNNYKYQRGWRRLKREFRYYFLENKMAFVFLLIILMASVTGILYLNFGLYHKSYGEYQSMNHNGLSIKVVNSLLTNMHTNGKLISKDKYYLAVSIDIKNNNNKSTRLDFENFKILDNGNYVMPSLDRSTYFPDLGLPYTRDMEIESNKEDVYVLVYEVDNIEQQYNLRILESLENTLIGITPIYKTIRLNYETIVNKYDLKTYELGKIIDFSDTIFNVSELQVNSYSFTNSYSYKVKKCSSKDVCQDVNKNVTVDITKYGSNKKILALDVFFQLDKTSYYYLNKKSSSSFINDFVLLRTTVNGKSKEYTVNSLTPNELKGVWLLAVDNEIEKAEKIDLLVTIHGKTFVMNLKNDKTK